MIYPPQVAGDSDLIYRWRFMLRRRVGGYASRPPAVLGPAQLNPSAGAPPSAAGGRSDGRAHRCQPAALSLRYSRVS